MSVAPLLNWDSVISLVMHVLKALVALALNWIVLRSFGVDEFVVWSVTSSVLIVAAAADLGIGQYVVTQLINARRDEWSCYVGQGLGALLPMTLIATFFILIELDGPTWLYIAAMSLIAAIRFLTIPFAAVLNAANEYKIRKVIEFVAYLFALILITAAILGKGDVYTALIILNATFLIAAVLTVLIAKRHIRLRLVIGSIDVRQSWTVFRAAIPFTLNNLTGLLTYGGFIWLSSTVLNDDDVAKLAVLHTFVLTNLFQFYDVFLKARQADLGIAARLGSYIKVNFVVMLVLPLAFFVGGREALALIGIGDVSFTGVEAGLYGLFIGLELGNLFVQSLAQVNLALVGYLKAYAAMRMAVLAVFLLVGLLNVPSELALLILLGGLSVGSLATFTYLHQKVGAILRRGETDSPGAIQLSRESL